MIKTHTKDQQRQQQMLRAMLAFKHELHLTNLLGAILAGDTSLLTEFQQQLQYAHPTVRDRLLKRLAELSRE